MGEENNSWHVGTVDGYAPSNKDMNSFRPELNLNTGTVRSLLSQLYTEADHVSDSMEFDGEDVPGFGTFISALNDALYSLSYRGNMLAADATELADSLTDTLHAIESADADAAHSLDKF